MFETREALLNKIRLGEDSLLELKVIRFNGGKISGPFRNDLADELAAFANTNDGVLVLGVDDKSRDVEGIAIDKLDAVEDFLRDICNDNIIPPLSAKIIRMELPDLLGEEKPIIKIEIPRSLFVHKSPGGYFRRLGNSKRQLTPDLLARLFQQRSQARIIRFDEQPVPATTAKNLEDKLWRRFAPDEINETVITLRKLSLVTAGDNGDENATVGGVLMCSQEPHKWLPGAFIEAVRYRGTRLDSNYQEDAAQITGPLDQQVHGALAFVRRNMKVAAVKEMGRMDIPQFSLRAVFEAVVNAVAHRDYSIHGSKIRLFMFDDRFELYSPGALPNTISIDSIALRQATRNELITSLLAKCPMSEIPDHRHRKYLMEKRGEGVPVIIAESEQLSGKTPIFRLLDDTELQLTIFAAKPEREN